MDTNNFLEGSVSFIYKHIRLKLINKMYMIVRYAKEVRFNAGVLLIKDSVILLSVQCINLLTGCLGVQISAICLKFFD